ncbi:hypothetical protein B0H14DRAFT_2643730 [Mycena olivaceomarginata]|nr:hypothetical protein B0H14DRAFT_2643730 [Mycena olivaceomarginata]
MQSCSQQLFAISDLPGSFDADPVTSQVSLEKLATFDAHPDILVLVAHDLSLRDILLYYPAYLIDWKANNFKETTVWNFVDETNTVFAFIPMRATLLCNMFPRSNELREALEIRQNRNEGASQPSTYHEGRIWNP